VKSKSIILLFLGLMIYNCNHREDPTENWKAILVSSTSFPVQPGMIMVPDKDSLVFTNRSSCVSFGCITNQDRLLLSRGPEKWLFTRGKSSDSLLIWEELYSDSPLIIQLSNQKKN